MVPDSDGQSTQGCQPPDSASTPIVIVPPGVGSPSLSASSSGATMPPSPSPSSLSPPPPHAAATSEIKASSTSNFASAPCDRGPELTDASPGASTGRPLRNGPGVVTPVTTRSHSTPLVTVLLRFRGDSVLLQGGLEGGAGQQRDRQPAEVVGEREVRRPGEVRRVAVAVLLEGGVG